jgi:hypothetical protein
VKSCLRFLFEFDLQVRDSQIELSQFEIVSAAYVPAALTAFEIQKFLPCLNVCVCFITAGPITKLFACVFITAVPIIRVGGGKKKTKLCS